MSPRATLVMLAVLVGLGAFWFLHDVKGGKEREEAKNREERLYPGLEAAQVTSLRLADSKAGDKPRLVLEKLDGRWVLRGEQDVLASQAEVTGLVDQVATLKRNSVIQEDPAPKALAQYGLDQPRYRLEVGTSSKPGVPTLLLGDRTPDESAFYARVGDQGPVLEVATAFMTSLEKPAGELREKSPLALEPSAVERLVLKPAQGPEIVLVRQEAPKIPEGVDAPPAPERWRLEAPIQAAADPRKVSDFLWAWKSLQAGRFLKADEPVDFSRPGLRVEITETGSKTPLVLEVGPPVAVKPGMFYVRRSTPVEAMVLEPGDKQKLLLGPTAADFEDRHLLAFGEDEVDRLEATVGERTVEARRIRDGWEIRKPADATRDESVRNSALLDLLDSARALEWTRRGGTEAPGSLGAPRATLSLYGKDGKLLGRLRVGPAAPGGGFQVAAGEGDAFVAEDPVPKWQGALSRLQKPAPAPSGSPATSPAP